MSTLCCRTSGGSHIHHSVLLSTPSINGTECAGIRAWDFKLLFHFNCFLRVDSILQYACITLDTASHKLSRREELRKKIQVKIIGI